MLAASGNDDGSGQIRIALALEFLQPGSHGRVARGSTHRVAGVLKIVSLLVRTLSAAHAVDDGTMMHVFGHGGQTITELDTIRTGRDAFRITHGVGSRHDAKGIEVGHAAGHVQIDDIARSRHLSGLRTPFKGRRAEPAAKHRQHGNSEAGFGNAEDEVSAGVFVGFDEGVHGGRSFFCRTNKI